MQETPESAREAYRQTDPDELILRDWLARDRTVLANERTLLAYIRTALALLAAGVGLIHFFDELSAQVTGWVMVALVPLIGAVGIWRFTSVRQRLKRVVRTSGSR